jgi:hypothetical protein
MNAKTPRREEEGTNAETRRRRERQREIASETIALDFLHFDPLLLGVLASRRSFPLLFLAFPLGVLGALAFINDSVRAVSTD